MRNFALNPKGVPERMKKVLEASRSNSLQDQEQLQYFRAMISETEKEDIATANYQDGFEDGIEKGIEKGVGQGEEKERLKNAINLKHLGVDTSIISQALGLTAEQIEAL